MRGKKSYVVCIALVEVIGLLLCVGDYLSERVFFDNTLERNEVGGEDVLEELQVQWGSEEETVKVEVSARQRSKKQCQQLFAAAIREIDESFPGKNVSADEIRRDVVIRDSYQQGQVEAEWEFDNDQVIDAEGVLEREYLTAEGTVVWATVYLSCQSYQTVYRFPFCVYAPKAGSREGMLGEIEDALWRMDRAEPEAAEVKLPEKVGGREVTWRPVPSYRGIQICLLGILAGAAILVGEKQDRRRQREKCDRERLLNYPEIVNQLSLLMGAGISFKGAMQRMAAQYGQRKARVPGYRQEGFEEVLRISRAMEAGMGEMEAVAKFGRHGGLREYRKLSLLLEQNLRKGSRELSAMLEKEDQEAFALRKHLARQEGEKASTKLLIPMVGLLFLVIVVLITPAFLTIQQ